MMPPATGKENHQVHHGIRGPVGNRGGSDFSDSPKVTTRRTAKAAAKGVNLPTRGLSSSRPASPSSSSSSDSSIGLRTRRALNATVAKDVPPKLVGRGVWTRHVRGLTLGMAPRRTSVMVVAPTSGTVANPTKKRTTLISRRATRGVVESPEGPKAIKQIRRTYATPRVSKVAKTPLALTVFDRVKEKRFSIGEQYSAVETAAKPEVLSFPVVLEDPPFHSILPQVVLNQNSVGTHQSLVRRGVNREVSIQFDFTIPDTWERNSFGILRFFSNPSVSPAPNFAPPNLVVSLNGKTLVEPEVVDYRNSKGKHGGCSPIEITRSLFERENDLFISWTDNTASGNDLPGFIAVIEMAKKKDLGQSLEEVKARKPIRIRTIRRIYRELTVIDADGIASSSRAVGLICPLSRKRMELPVRGKRCSHVECFDAGSYLGMNQAATAKWMCPYCNTRVAFGDLIVDKFIEEALQFTPSPTVEVTAVENYVVIREVKKVPGRGSLPEPGNQRGFRKTGRGNHVLDDTIVIE